MKFVQLVCLYSLLISSARGFAFQNPFQVQKEAGNPDLLSIAKAVGGASLDLKLDVGSNEESHMNIQGFVLEFSPEDADGMDDLRPKLPGSEGPNTNVSAGAKSIVIKEKPYFVSMAGKQQVPLGHGCWELVWREGAGAGVIVCGFLLEQAIERNDAVLDKGRIYMSLPVWTKKGLENQQEYKRLVEARAKKHEEEKLEAYKKMEETNNILVKALQFRNAAHASEQLSYVPLESVAQVPSDNDVIPLGKDLMITNKGTVWTKETKPYMFGGEYIHHTLLGTVAVSPAKATVSSALKP